MADSTITVTDVALGGKKLKTSEADGVHTLKVDASGGTAPVSGTVAVSSVAGTVTVAGTATVSATNLDIRDLTSATDSVTVQGGNSTAVKVDGSGVTQPVSGSVTVSATNLDVRDLSSASDSVKVEGGNTSAVKVDGSGVTQPVSGTFWQATQPVSIATMPSTPVTGTFWQTTQPVSGTFWPDTQPISGSVSITGTPSVSGTVTANQGTAGDAYWLASAKFVDENGAAYGVKHVSNKPRVSAMPYTYDIAEGNVTNHTPWSKIGIHLAISTSELDMRPYAAATAGIGWSYPWPSGALTMTIVSDSAEDDADKTPAAGTGAYTVTVYYLDAAFAEKTVTVTMNGTGAVQIGTDVYRVQNARVATAGTAGTAVGNLTIASGGTTYGFITAGKTRMRQCTWTVPASKVLYVTQIAFSCSDQAAGKYVRFTTKANYDEKSGLVLQRGLFMPYNEVTLNNTAYIRELNPPTKLPATVDLKVSAISNSAAAGTCALRGWVETA